MDTTETSNRLNNLALRYDSVVQNYLNKKETKMNNNYSLAKQIVNELDYAQLATQALHVVVQVVKLVAALLYIGGVNAINYGRQARNACDALIATEKAVLVKAGTKVAIEAASEQYANTLVGLVSTTQANLIKLVGKARVAIALWKFNFYKL